MNYSMSSDNLDFGRDCAEISVTLIGILSPGTMKKASKAKQTCRSAAQQDRTDITTWHRTAYLCLAAGTSAGRLDVRSRGAVPSLAGGQPPAPPDWHRS